MNGLQFRNQRDQQSQRPMGRKFQQNTSATLNRPIFSASVPKHFDGFSMSRTELMTALTYLTAKDKTAPLPDIYEDLRMIDQEEFNLNPRIKESDLREWQLPGSDTKITEELTLPPKIMNLQLQEYDISDVFTLTEWSRMQERICGKTNNRRIQKRMSNKLDWDKAILANFHQMTTGPAKILLANLASTEKPEGQVFNQLTMDHQKLKFALDWIEISLKTGPNHSNLRNKIWKKYLERRQQPREPIESYIYNRDFDSIYGPGIRPLRMMNINLGKQISEAEEFDYARTYVREDLQYILRIKDIKNVPFDPIDNNVDTIVTAIINMEPNQQGQPTQPMNPIPPQLPTHQRPENGRNFQSDRKFNNKRKRSERYCSHCANEDLKEGTPDQKRRWEHRTTHNTEDCGYAKRTTLEKENTAVSRQSNTRDFKKRFNNYNRTAQVAAIELPGWSNDQISEQYDQTPTNDWHEYSI